ncbi:MAG: MmgE/PrpD family protein, partial [Geminicoccaceae bacterium]
NHAARRHGCGPGHDGKPDCVPMPFNGRGVNGVGYAFAGAATIDGVDGHDGHQHCKGDAGAAVLPALLAELGGAPTCSLDELLAHLIVGYEIAIRAGLSLHATAPDYHSSGAWNALGCAAVAARLRRFSTEQTRHALGIAEYFGPRAQMMRCIDHPSMVKDSTSWGAMTGISAADLAESGFTGAPAITCEAADVTSYWGDLGSHWRILETNFKAYPVCRWAHPPIEATLGLIRDHDIQPERISDIVISTFHEAARLATTRPKDGDQAQYSLPLAVALALIHGTINPDHVLPGNYDRPEVWRLVDGVRIVEEAAYNAAFPAERYADVTLTLSDGQRLSSGRMTARGNYDAPLPDQEILAKLEQYATPVLSKERRAAIARILITPERAPSPAELVALLTPTRVSSSGARIDDQQSPGSIRD